MTNDIIQETISQYQHKKIELLLQLGQETHRKLLMNNFDLQELITVSANI